MSYPPNPPQRRRALLNRFLLLFVGLSGVTCFCLTLYRSHLAAKISCRDQHFLPTARTTLKDGPDGPNCVQEISRSAANHKALSHSAQGDALYERGEYVGAAEAYRISIEANPASESIHCKLGVCLASLGLFDEAIDALNEAINVAPDYPEAHYEIGKVLLQTMRFAEAAEHLREVTKLKPERPEPYNQLGLAWARQGQLTPATAAFKRAIQLDPNHVAARFNLAQVYLQRGATAPAARELEYTLRINPNFTAAKTALDQLTRRPRNSPDSLVRNQSTAPRNQRVDALVLVPGGAALRSE